MIDNLVVKLMLLSLSCQMYFDSSVLLESFLWVNVECECRLDVVVVTCAL